MFKKNNIAIEAESLLEYVSDGIIVSDDYSAARVLYANAATAKILGFNNTDLALVHLTDLVHPADLSKVKDYHKELKKKKHLTTVRRIKRKDGRYILLERNAQVLDNGYVVSIIRDVTELHELEHRKDTFISIASHELRTPVTSIRLYTEIAARLLKDNEPASEVLPMLDKIQDQVERLKNLIGDMLNLSKIQAGKLEFRMDFFDLDTLAREAAEHMRAAAKKKLTLSVKGSITQKVYGDKDRIYQVLINLLSNAIKYSPDSHEVEVMLGEKKGEVLVSVIDFGIGIKKDELKKIFQRFYRVPGTAEHTFSGMGIGLFLCKEIIRKHKGTLIADSIHGKGSTFTFSLPVGKEKTEG